MRARGVALAVVLTAVVCVRWLLTDAYTNDGAALPAARAEEATAPRATPVEEAIAVAPPRWPADAAVAPSPAAGAAVEKPEDVEVAFKLLRDDAPAVGERLTLSRDGVRVSGLVDVVGAVKLSLAPGAWFVDAPRAVSPDRVIVTPGLGTQTLRIGAREALSGCVTDEAGAPVAARVSVKGATDELLETGDGGCFSLAVQGSKASLQATAATGRSPVKRVTLPASGVSLVIARENPLTIRYQPADLDCANVVVSGPSGPRLGHCHSGGPCEVRVPATSFTVDAVGIRNGVLLYGAASVAAPPSSGEVVVSLSAMPPISGAVRDASDVPVAGVTLRFNPLYGKPFSLPDVVSGNDGSFSVTPTAIEYLCSWEVPAWMVSVAPPWKLTSGFIARIGEPLQVRVEHAKP